MSNSLKALAAFGCLAVGWIWGSFAPQPSQIAFLSVGQGDCAVIRSGGRTVLIDVGPKSPRFDAGEKLVLPKLRALGVESVDLVLISHPDLDHMGGLGAILKKFPSARIGVSAVFREDPEMRSHLAAMNVSPARIDWLPRENGGKIGRLPLHIFCPERRPGKNANDGSMFVHIGQGPASAVFSGDAPMSEEAIAANEGEWTASLMKAGHHGSRTSSGDAWLNEVHPKWVVLSLGRDNPYGHPHREAIERISASEAQILRTDRDGDIVFDITDDGLRPVVSRETMGD